VMMKRARQGRSLEVRGLVPDPLNKPKNSPGKLKIALTLLAPGGRDIRLRFADNFWNAMVQDLQNATNLDMSNCKDEDRFQGIHCPLCIDIHAS
jgi:hypothetical protein